MAIQPLILNAFLKLGHFLREFSDTDTTPKDTWSIKMVEAIQNAGQKNGWFTRDNVMYALKSWGQQLKEEQLKDWLSKYSIDKNLQPKTIAIIMAGNIPLVGFHDFIAVLFSGNRVIAKLSSNDAVLLPFISEYLIDCEPQLAERILFTQEKLSEFDAVIATGSNNTSRYFDYYFGKYPNIIRKNRSSVAVLSGEETKEELHALGKDIFQYFGLGCRSVSKLFVPKGYDFRVFFESIFDYQDIVNVHKYANNYDYNKAVFLMSEFNILDNNFLLLKEDESYASPIGTLYYEHYESIEVLNQRLDADTSKLQCVVGNTNITRSIPFGTTQNPALNDYADGIDTVQFLLDL